MENFIEKIRKEAAKLESKVTPTINDRYQFEINTKNKYLADRLNENADTLERYKNSIGSELYKLKKSFAYSENSSSDNLNQTEDIPVLFTKELFEQFQLDSINWWIEYYSKELIRGLIVENSSSKLSNLQFEWKVQMKQKLIGFYNELLGKY